MSTEAAAYTVLALVLGVSVAWSHGWWARGRYDTARRTAVFAERAARPRDRRPAIEDAVQIELAEACCELWWTSMGTTHDTDPDRCTRKDQTT